MKRRTFLLGASLLPILGCSTTPQKESFGEIQGCCLQSGQLDQVLTDSSSLYASLTPRDPLISFSGNIDFDRALGRQLILLAKTFEVRPGVAYADDSGSPNALASPETRIAETQGIVIIGLQLLRETLAQGKGGDIAILGVCAHEFGHIHQFTMGNTHAYLLSQHNTVKLVELHADFLSGFS